MNKKIEDLEEISQKECDAVFCDVRIDLKHTSKEDLLKMLQSQVEINAAIKKELDTQNSAIKILRANAVKPGNIQVNKESLVLAHKECMKTGAALAQVALDRVNGNEKQERILLSQLCNNRVTDIIAGTGALESDKAEAETSKDRA